MYVPEDVNVISENDISAMTDTFLQRWDDMKKNMERQVLKDENCSLIIAPTSNEQSNSI